MDTDFPFGRDNIDTLIVCKSTGHKLAVIEAFKIKAMYTVWGGALTGRRFMKAIVFPFDSGSDIQNQAMEDYYQTNLRTKIMPGGKIHIV